MKNQSTRTSLALLATAIVAYPIVNRISSVDQTAHASVPVAAMSAAATSSLNGSPYVTFEWEMRAMVQWCSCEGGCVRPGGLCEPVQRFRIDSNGNAQNLGPCDFVPLDLGNLVIQPNEVLLVGPNYSASGWAACTPDCCSTCDQCFMGGPNYAIYQTLTFEYPVWHEFPGETSESPRRVFNLAAGGFASFRFTNEQADFNADGMIAGDDLTVLLALWGMPQWRRVDLNDDWNIDGADLALLFAKWGPIP